MEGTDLDILIYIIGVICLVAFIVATIATFIAYGVYSAFKLVFGVPWLRWLTLNEIVAMGHSRYWCEILLPIFYRKGNVFMGCTLHIRLPHDASDAVRAFTEMMGFRRETVQYYEFKFTSRGEGRRGKLQKSRVEILQPVPLCSRHRSHP